MWLYDRAAAGAICVAFHLLAVEADRFVRLRQANGTEIPRTDSPETRSSGPRRGLESPNIRHSRQKGVSSALRLVLH